MLVVSRPEELGETPSAVAVGVFDGVHLGHQRVVGRAVEAAARHDWRSVAVTFDPLPEAVLFPERGVERITTRGQKLELLASLGLAATLVVPFTAEFASLGAGEFAQEYLASVGARELFAGFDLRLGRGREAGWEALAAYGAQFGMRVRPVEPALHGEEKISSTRIRQALLEGDVATAATMLGRYHAVCGEVVKGAGVGRRLGVKTANIEHPEGMLPAGGVYACWTRALGKRWMAAASLGHPAVFRDAAERPPAPVEVALIGLDADIYGERIEIEFVRRLREVERFESSEELASRIRGDLVAAEGAVGEDRSPFFLRPSGR